MRSHAVLLSLLALGGCAGALGDGPIFDTHLLLPTAPETIQQPDGTSKSVPPGSTTDGTKAFSDMITPVECAKADPTECVPALRSIIDLKYQQYKIGLRALAVNTGAVGDLMSLGLSGAATATGGAGVKTVLSAINAGITGAKSTLNSDYLFGKTIDVVIQQMDTDRDSQYVVIQKGLNAKTYSSMSLAKDDLMLYYYDGTFAHALASLQKSTAADADAAGACKQKAMTNSDMNDCTTTSSHQTVTVPAKTLLAPPAD